MAPIAFMIAIAFWASGFLLRGRLQRCASATTTKIGPLVSGIIPARNEEQSLPALLRSIASQTVKPNEIIVVDDGSTDRTAEVARGLVATVIPSPPLRSDTSSTIRPASPNGSTSGLR